MFHFTCLFADEASARETADMLWEKHKVTGEMHLKPVEDSWRLEVTAEKEPPARILEQLKQQEVSFDSGA